PPVGVGHGHAVHDIDDVVAPGGRGRQDRWRDGADQPRPMFGRLPWFAFERRMRAFFFLVFLDMEDQPTWAGGRVTRHDGGRRDRPGPSAPAEPRRPLANEGGD